jgi:membrane protease YdiL (CAAX protease family)
MNTDPSPEFREDTTGRLQPPPAIVRFVLAVALALIVSTVLPRITFGLFGNHVVLADAAYRWLGCVVLLAGFLFFTRVLDQVEGDAWSYLGLPRTSAAVMQTLAGIGLGALLITIAVVAIQVVGGGRDLHVEMSVRAAIRLIEVSLLLLGGALLEELMFRGYPFQRLLESIGVPGAIVVLSAFFGALHLGNPNSGGFWSWGFFNTLAVGILFALAYLRTRTLWFPFGIHFGWNFFLGVVYGLPVSGIKDFSVVVRATAHGPKLLTGGAYGVEASLTGSAVILLGMLLIGIMPKRMLRGLGKPDVSAAESI